THLPTARAALDHVAGQLDEYRHGIVTTAAAVREHAQALAEQAEQATRLQTANAELEQVGARARQQQQYATKIEARYQELKAVAGASAEEVLARLAALETQQRELQQAQELAQEQFVAAREQLGAARQHAHDSEARRLEQEQARSAAIAQLQAFAQTGLLSAAVPELELPALDLACTSDPALRAARGAEQALADVADTDADWKRVQDRIGSEFNELNRAMSARGHASSGEPTDHGYIVLVTFNQRHEPPHRLQALLEAEIVERRSL